MPLLGCYLNLFVAPDGEEGQPRKPLSGLPPTEQRLLAYAVAVFAGLVEKFIERLVVAHEDLGQVRFFVPVLALDREPEPLRANQVAGLALLGVLRYLAPGPPVAGPGRAGERLVEPGRQDVP